MFWLLILPWNVVWTLKALSFFWSAIVGDETAKEKVAFNVQLFKGEHPEVRGRAPFSFLQCSQQVRNHPFYSVLVSVMAWGNRGSGGRPMFGGSAVRSPHGKLHHGRCVLGQDTLPTLPRVNVYDCCMVGGAICAEWQPRFRQSAPGQLWLLS